MELLPQRLATARRTYPPLPTGKGEGLRAAGEEANT